MKNLINYTVVLLLLVFSGCSEDLESVKYDDINPSIFPSSEADVQAIVASAYYPLRGSYGNGIHSTSENGLMFILDATTEILQGPYGVQQEASLHSYKASSTSFTRFYDVFYNKISNMTLSIDRIEKSNVNEQIKKKAIAEVRCARGLLAYELFDLYGPIVVAPLEVLKNPLDEQPLARLSNAEMVSFIENDLKAAAAELKSPAETPYGRFSNGLARMVLIRLYLHEKRWAEVEEQATAIMDMNYYGLEENYAGLWDITAPVSSKEVIWAVPADYAGTSENQWQLMVLPNNFPGRGGYGTIQSSWKFYDSFESTDIRKMALIAEFTGTDGVTYNRANPANYMQLGPIPLKIHPDAARTTALTTVDMIIYRYADVLLSRAEALVNKTGTPTQAAIDLVNIVRRRAKISEIELVNYATLAKFNEMILLERSHEYWCENGQYRSDLIRHGKFTEHAIDLNGAASQSEPYKALFPFSLAKISEGKGKFIQNQGYN
ncbi:RagB/SusD family nutrient uptake outer membrane protein [Flavobacterium sp. GA093]|uniref:RagB/SusD family nutrient uptake outer membrane protein n=1 Tax=Flavobacterium hydrocarbonoxydans TaxID=2683249 RepID=A0A6I4NY40_9FLAO|nr:RagB/SusD family nutrient uptake outer membrane protein [Flavobacterium hydrocarbonoxydans]MWB95937.1 RagB/SusD family nutrient uptake outer membrane protein [Flavobacterium hydrocarbonoxydans]